MKRKKSVFIVLLTLALFMSFAAGSFAAPAETLREKGGIIGIANRGLWTEYPENSLEGVLKVKETGLRFVLVDVSRTRDGVLVLLEETSAGRMLGTEEENVGALTYGEIAALPLRNRVGGRGNAFTEYTVPTLTRAVSSAKEAGLRLVLKLDVSLLDDAISLAGENAVYFITGKTADVKAAVKTHGGSVEILTEKRSNVIFDVLSFLNFMKSAGAVGVNLKTTNRYGVNFYKSTLKHFDSLQAVADTSDYETAGFREDTVKWWDDLISRGYTAVITDDPAAFGAYLRENEAARARLDALYREITGEKTLPAFGNEILSDYKKAYTDALTEAERLLADPSSSLGDMRDCYTALSSAVKNLELRFDEIEAGRAGRSVTLPRILLCAAAAAVVILVQIYFYKRRKQK